MKLKDLVKQNNTLKEFLKRFYYTEYRTKAFYELLIDARDYFEEDLTEELKKQGTKNEQL
tara:strand:+ start:663 stop:842 length:180 start_codon:yes stop_codon:yes gene_type:complete